MATIDHIILNVNEIAASVDFYVNVLGFKLEGEDGPFTVIRVSEDFTIQLAPWGTKGNEHLAFALSRPDFDEAFARLKEKGIAYGDSFHSGDGLVSVSSAAMGRPAWTALDDWETNHPREVNWGTNLVPTPLELADSSIVEKYRTLANQITAIK